MFYNILYKFSTTWCNMSQQFMGCWTESLSIVTSMCFTVVVYCNLHMTWKSCPLSDTTKIVDLSGVSTCCVTSFECLQHIHLSLQQGMTDPSMTSKSCSLSYFEHSSNWFFSIHSLWRYNITSIKNMSIWLKPHFNTLPQLFFSISDSAIDNSA